MLASQALHILLTQEKVIFLMNAHTKILALHMSAQLVWTDLMHVSYVYLVCRWIEEGSVVAVSTLVGIEVIDLLG